MKVYIFILMFLLASNVVSAATIRGTIYDLNLDPVKNAVIEVNSTPKQLYVSKDGNYLFELPPGSYLIKAALNNESFDEQEIEINKEGDFIIDLILFPTLEEDKELFEEENLSAFEIKKEKNLLPYILTISLIALLLFLIIFYFIKKRNIKPKKELPEDLKNLVEVIKKQGGRITQKELRKEIPVSEAKISLMIAELEEKGIIKKIKKGRGNIIILV